MTRKKLSGRPSHLAMACAATALVATACNRGQTPATTAPPLDALPLTSTTSAPVVPAPTASALPMARPARIARLVQPEESYAYLDRASAASDGYADAPPDYAVDYSGERPWVWRGADASERVVERTPQGLRYYYFEPGASQPYLVQDADYAYGYSGGQLVAVYGPDGALQPYGVVERRAGLAGRYLAWGAGLYAASLHQQRLAVEQAHWQEQRADIAAQRAAWSAQQSRYDAWNAYHAAHAAEEEAHWADERGRRTAEAQHYAPAFGGGGFPGGPGEQTRTQGPAPAPSGGRDRLQPQQTFAQGGGYPPPTPNQGYDPRAAQPRLNGYDPRAYGQGERGASVQAQVDSQAVLNQPRPSVLVQRQAAEQAHAAQLQAQARQVQARDVAEAQRESTLQQARSQAQAQREAADQAHAGQVRVQRAQQLQLQAAEAQRQATLQQARAQAQAQRQLAEQAHAAQQAARVQQEQTRASEEGREAERNQAQAARVGAEQQARGAAAQRAAGEEAQRLAQQEARTVRQQSESRRPTPAPPQQHTDAPPHADDHHHDHRPGEHL